MDVRRFRRAVLAGILATALLGTTASCTRTGGGDSRTIEVLTGINSDHLQQQRDYFATVSREFEKQTGYKVTFRTYASSSDEQQQLQSSVISGSGPDVFSLGTTFVPTAYATGAFHVLSEDDWRVLGGRDRFVPQQLSMSGPSRDKQIGVPYATQPFVMVYNTEMFRKAGISGPPRTWSQFVADAKKLTHPDKGVYGVATDPADGFDPWKYIWMMTLQSGGRLISDDRRRAELDSPQVLNGTSFWLDWFTRHKIADPHGVTWQGSNALAAVAGGKAAMQMMVSAGSIPTLDDSKIKGKYAFAPMPTVPYGRTSRPPGGLNAASIVSGQDYAVAQYSEKKDVALKLVRYLTGRRNQLRSARLFGDIPADAGAAATVVGNDPRLRGFMTAERHTKPTTFTGGWATLQIALGTVIAQTLPELTKGGYDRASLGARLRQINTQLQAALDQQRKAERKEG
ncbi:MAG: extracellular solute-binding protein [Actinocatenispora sp.]